MRRKKSLLSVFALGASIACTLGPEPARPVNPADKMARFIHATDETAVSSDMSEWWDDLRDPYVSRLVDEACASNYELAAAAARVAEAQAALASARGQSLPEVSGSVDATRRKFSFVLPGISRSGIYSTTFSDELSLSYPLDLFGKVTRTRQAAWAGYLAGRAERLALLHSIVADIVITRVEEAALREQSTIAREIASRKETIAALVRDRYQAGIVGPDSVREALSAAAEARARAEDLSSAADLALYSMNVLAGKRPGDEPPPPFPWRVAPDLPPVPPLLPASPLDRKPDLIQSPWRAAAATPPFGSALAHLPPALSRTARPLPFPPHRP